MNKDTKELETKIRDILYDPNENEIELSILRLFHQENTKARKSILVKVDPYIDPEFRELFESLEAEEGKIEK